VIANQSLAIARNNVIKSNYTSTWILATRSQPATTAQNALNHFINATTNDLTNERINILNHPSVKNKTSVTSENGVDQDLMKDKTDGKKDSIMSLKKALSDESQSLRNAHAAAKKVEDYLISMKTKVVSSITNITTKTYENVNSELIGNLESLNNIEKILNNRTVEKQLEFIVQAGVDIVYLRKQLNRQIPLTDTIVHNTASVNTLMKNPVSVEESLLLETIGSSATGSDSATGSVDAMVASTGAYAGAATGGAATGGAATGGAATGGAATVSPAAPPTVTLPLPSATGIAAVAPPQVDELITEVPSIVPTESDELIAFLKKVDLSSTDGVQMIHELLKDQINGSISSLLIYPPSPTKELIVKGDAINKTLTRINSIQLSLQKKLHLRNSMINELKTIIQPSENIKNSLYNKNILLTINASLAEIQLKSPCIYPPFSSDGDVDEMNILCIALRSMNKDVSNFVHWNKALDLELAGGYTRAKHTIPGFDFILRNNETRIVQKDLIHALNVAENRAHERRIISRAVARRSLAISARKKTEAGKKTF
jgi:hypothetical protein